MNTNRFQIRKTSAMGFKRVSKLIEKINVLHDSLLSIDEEMSSIEKDLLLNYIRQLYEQVLEIGTEGQSAPIPSIAKQVIDLPKEEIRAKVQELPTQNRRTEYIEQEKPTPVQVDEVQSPVTATKVEVVEEIEEQKPVDNGHPAHDLSMEDINSELVLMFEMKEAKELSEKLSSTPIKNLKTAMGINDRFLTVNELFGGNSDAFKNCIDHINELDTYEEAKSYLLLNDAQKYDWSSAEKLKKAAGFISLVQRRFR